jgi:hypothetical protein
MENISLKIVKTLRQAGLIKEDPITVTKVKAVIDEYIDTLQEEEVIENLKIMGIL